MKKSPVIPLIKVEAGEAVRVIGVHGGPGLASRLEALGIRPGTNIVKKSAIFMGGPVIVEVHGTQIAIGHGMAARTMVETIN
ncbi:MAG: ferrous iron transport protein A [Firmicutes bacterium]|nr:ferrous iron transport protein A [Bacillota bacterium]